MNNQKTNKRKVCGRKICWRTLLEKKSCMRNQRRFAASVAGAKRVSRIKIRLTGFAEPKASMHRMQIKTPLQKNFSSSNAVRSTIPLKVYIKRSKKSEDVCRRMHRLREDCEKIARRSREDREKKKQKWKVCGWEILLADTFVNRKSCMRSLRAPASRRQARRKPSVCMRHE